MDFLICTGIDDKKVGNKRYVCDYDHYMLLKSNDNVTNDVFDKYKCVFSLVNNDADEICPLTLELTLNEDISFNEFDYKTESMYFEICHCNMRTNLLYTVPLSFLIAFKPYTIVNNKIYIDIPNHINLSMIIPCYENTTLNKPQYAMRIKNSSIISECKVMCKRTYFCQSVRREKYFNKSSFNRIVVNIPSLIHNFYSSKYVNVSLTELVGLFKGLFIDFNTPIHNVEHFKINFNERTEYSFNNYNLLYVGQKINETTIYIPFDSVSYETKSSTFVNFSRIFSIKLQLTMLEPISKIRIYGYNICSMFVNRDLGTVTIEAPAEEIMHKIINA